MVNLLQAAPIESEPDAPASSFDAFLCRLESLAVAIATEWRLRLGHVFNVP
jgi:hypothetical protein